MKTSNILEGSSKVVNIPVDSQNLKSMPLWVDVDAQKEEKSWNKLDEVRLRNDSLWLEAYGDIVITLTWIFSIIFILSLIVWALHYITPYWLHWLEQEQLNKIQSVLFSGGMGAIVSGVIRAQLSKT
jgi:hypothetical protein